MAWRAWGSIEVTVYPVRVDRVNQGESDVWDSRCSAVCPSTISERGTVDLTA